jgi:hypothetical protein
VLRVVRDKHELVPRAGMKPASDVGAVRIPGEHVPGSGGLAGPPERHRTGEALPGSRGQDGHGSPPGRNCTRAPNGARLLPLHVVRAVAPEGLPAVVGDGHRVPAGDGGSAAPEVESNPRIGHLHATARERRERGATLHGRSRRGRKGGALACYESDQQYGILCTHGLLQLGEVRTYLVRNTAIYDCKAVFKAFSATYILQVLLVM